MADFRTNYLVSITVDKLKELQKFRRELTKLDKLLKDRTTNIKVKFDVGDLRRVVAEELDAQGTGSKRRPRTAKATAADKSTGVSVEGANILTALQGINTSIQALGQRKQPPPPSAKTQAAQAATAGAPAAAGALAPRGVLTTSNLRNRANRVRKLRRAALALDGALEEMIEQGAAGVRLTSDAFTDADDRLRNLVNLVQTKGKGKTLSSRASIESVIDLAKRQRAQIETMIRGQQRAINELSVVTKGGVKKAVAGKIPSPTMDIRALENQITSIGEIIKRKIVNPLLKLANLDLRLLSKQIRKAAKGGGAGGGGASTAGAAAAAAAAVVVAGGGGGGGRKAATAAAAQAAVVAAEEVSGPLTDLEKKAIVTRFKQEAKKLRQASPEAQEARENRRAARQERGRKKKAPGREKKVAQQKSLVARLETEARSRSATPERRASIKARTKLAAETGLILLDDPEAVTGGRVDPNRRGRRTLPVLAQVPGLGPARIKTLMERFGSVKALQDASVADIQGVRGFGSVLARQVHATVRLDQQAPQAAQAQFDNAALTANALAQIRGGKAVITDRQVTAIRTDAGAGALGLINTANITQNDPAAVKALTTVVAGREREIDKRIEAFKASGDRSKKDIAAFARNQRVEGQAALEKEFDFPRGRFPLLVDAPKIRTGGNVKGIKLERQQANTKAGIEAARLAREAGLVGPGQVAVTPQAAKGILGNINKALNLIESVQSVRKATGVPADGPVVSARRTDISTIPTTRGITRLQGQVEDLEAAGRFQEAAPLRTRLRRLQRAARPPEVVSRRVTGRSNITIRDLHELPGIGPARTKALLDQFGSINAIQNASVTDIRRVKGFGPILAQKLHAAVRQPAQIRVSRLPRGALKTSTDSVGLRRNVEVETALIDQLQTSGVLPNAGDLSKLGLEDLHDQLLTAKKVISDARTEAKPFIGRRRRVFPTKLDDFARADLLTELRVLDKVGTGKVKRTKFFKEEGFAQERFGLDKAGLDRNEQIQARINDIQAKLETGDPTARGKPGGGFLSSKQVQAAFTPAVIALADANLAGGPVKDTPVGRAAAARIAARAGTARQRDAADFRAAALSNTQGAARRAARVAASLGVDPRTGELLFEGDQSLIKGRQRFRPGAASDRITRRLLDPFEVRERRAGIIAGGGIGGGGGRGGGVGTGGKSDDDPDGKKEAGRVAAKRRQANEDLERRRVRNAQRLLERDRQQLDEAGGKDRAQSFLSPANQAAINRQFDILGKRTRKIAGLQDSVAVRRAAIARLKEPADIRRAELAAGKVSSQARAEEDVFLRDLARAGKVAPGVFGQFQGDIQQIASFENQQVRARARIKGFEAEKDRLAGPLPPQQAKDLRRVQKTLEDLTKAEDGLRKSTTGRVKAAADGNRSLRTTRGFGQQLTETFRRVAFFGFSGLGLFAVIGQISRAVRESIQLQSSLARIQGIIGRGGAGGRAVLRSGALGIAQQFGVGIPQSVATIQTFAQTGLRGPEAIAAARTAIAGEVGAGLLPGQSKELLIAIRNISQNQIIGTDILDRISRIESTRAVTAKDLALALQRIGALAKQLQPEQLGAIDFADLVIGATSTIIERTRVSGIQAATGLKFILSRLARPEVTNKLQEEFGIQLAANRAGTALRPASDILSDVAAEFIRLNTGGTESESLRAKQLLQTIAGARQLNVAAALFSDFDSVLRTATDSAQAFGDTQRRVAIQMETLEKRLAQVQVAFVSVVDVVLRDIGLVAGLESLAKSITKGDVTKNVGFAGAKIGGTIAIGGAIASFLGAKGVATAGAQGIGSIGKFFGQFAKIAVSIGRFASIAGVLLGLIGLVIAGLKLFNQKKVSEALQKEQFGLRGITATELQSSELFKSLRARASGFGVTPIDLVDRVGAAVRAVTIDIETRRDDKGKLIFGDVFGKDRIKNNRLTITANEELVKQLDLLVPGFRELGDVAKRTAAALALVRDVSRLSGANIGAIVGSLTQSTNELTARVREQAGIANNVGLLTVEHLIDLKNPKEVLLGFELFGLRRGEPADVFRIGTQRRLNKGDSALLPLGFSITGKAIRTATQGLDSALVLQQTGNIVRDVLNQVFSPSDEKNIIGGAIGSFIASGPLKSEELAIRIRDELLSGTKTFGQIVDNLVGTLLELTVAQKIRLTNLKAEVLAEGKLTDVAAIEVEARSRLSAEDTDAAERQRNRAQFFADVDRSVRVLFDQPGAAKRTREGLSLLGEAGGGRLVNLGVEAIEASLLTRVAELEGGQFDSIATIIKEFLAGIQDVESRERFKADLSATGAANRGLVLVNDRLLNLLLTNRTARVGIERRFELFGPRFGDGRVVARAGLSERLLGSLSTVQAQLSADSIKAQQRFFQAQLKKGVDTELASTEGASILLATTVADIRSALLSTEGAGGTIAVDAKTLRRLGLEVTTLQGALEAVKSNAELFATLPDDIRADLIQGIAPDSAFTLNDLVVTFTKILEFAKKQAILDQDALIHQQNSNALLFLQARLQSSLLTTQNDLRNTARERVVAEAQAAGPQAGRRAVLAQIIPNFSDDLRTTLGVIATEREAKLLSSEFTDAKLPQQTEILRAFADKEAEATQKAVLDAITAFNDAFQGQLSALRVELATATNAAIESGMSGLVGVLSSFEAFAAPDTSPLTNVAKGLFGGIAAQLQGATARNLVDSLVGEGGIFRKQAIALFGLTERERLAIQEADLIEAGMTRAAEFQGALMLKVGEANAKLAAQAASLSIEVAARAAAKIATAAINAATAVAVATAKIAAGDAAKTAAAAAAKDVPELKGIGSIPSQRAIATRKRDPFTFDLSGTPLQLPQQRPGSGVLLQQTPGSGVLLAEFRNMSITDKQFSEATVNALLQVQATLANTQGSRLTVDTLSTAFRTALANIDPRLGSELTVVKLSSELQAALANISPTLGRVVQDILQRVAQSLGVEIAKSLQNLPASASGLRGIGDVPTQTTRGFEIFKVMERLFPETTRISRKRDPQGFDILGVLSRLEVSTARIVPLSEDIKSALEGFRALTLADIIPTDIATVRGKNSFAPALIDSLETITRVGARLKTIIDPAAFRDPVSFTPNIRPSLPDSLKTLATTTLQLKDGIVDFLTATRAGGNQFLPSLPDSLETLAAATLELKNTLAADVGFGGVGNRIGIQDIAKLSDPLKLAIDTFTADAIQTTISSLPEGTFAPLLSGRGFNLFDILDGRGANQPSLSRRDVRVPRALVELGPEFKEAISNITISDLIVRLPQKTIEALETIFPQLGEDIKALIAKIPDGTFAPALSGKGFNLFDILPDGRGGKDRITANLLDTSTKILMQDLSITAKKIGDTVERSGFDLFGVISVLGETTLQSQIRIASILDTLSSTIGTVGTTVETFASAVSVAALQIANRDLRDPANIPFAGQGGRRGTPDDMFDFSAILDPIVLSPAQVAAKELREDITRRAKEEARRKALIVQEEARKKAEIRAAQQASIAVATTAVALAGINIARPKPRLAGGLSLEEALPIDPLKPILVDEPVLEPNKTEEALAKAAVIVDRLATQGLTVRTVQELISELLPTKDAEGEPLTAGRKAILSGARTIGSFGGAALGFALAGDRNNFSSEISTIGSTLGQLGGAELLGFLGSAAGPVGAIVGGLAGGLLGSLFGKGEPEPPKQVSALERVEFNTRETVTAIREQTALLNLDNRLLNVPSSFRVSDFRPLQAGGGSSAAGTVITGPITIEINDARDPEAVAIAVRRELQGSLRRQGSFSTIKI